MKACRSAIGHILIEGCLTGVADVHREMIFIFIVEFSHVGFWSGYLLAQRTGRPGYTVNRHRCLQRNGQALANVAQAKEVPLGIIGRVVACALVGIHGKTLGNALTQIRGVSVVGYLVNVNTEFFGGVGVQGSFVRGWDGETLVQFDIIPIDLIVFLPPVIALIAAITTTAIRT